MGHQSVEKTQQIYDAKNYRHRNAHVLGRFTNKVMDALTIVTSPARRAKMAIMNSIALPNVALIRAETVLETRCEMIPVASTMRCEIATRAAAALAKETTGAA